MRQNQLENEYTNTISLWKWSLPIKAETKWGAVSLRSVDKEKPSQIHTEFILPQTMGKWSILL